MANFYYDIKLTNGTAPGPYTIYYNSVSPSNIAVIYGTTTPATGISYSTLTSSVGVRVTVPDTSTSIIIYNEQCSLTVQTLTLLPYVFTLYTASEGIKELPDSCCNKRIAVEVRSNCSVLDISCTLLAKNYSPLPNQYYTDDNGNCYTRNSSEIITGITECIIPVLVFNDSTDIPISNVTISGSPVTYVSGTNFTINSLESGTFETLIYGTTDVVVQYSNHTTQGSVRITDSDSRTWGCNTDTIGGICTYPDAELSLYNSITIIVDDTLITKTIYVDNLSTSSNIPVYDIKVNNVTVTYVTGTDFIIYSGQSGEFNTSELGYYNIEVFYSNNSGGGEIELIDSDNTSYTYAIGNTGGSVIFENILVQIGGNIFINIKDTINN